MANPERPTLVHPYASIDKSFWRAPFTIYVKGFLWRSAHGASIGVLEQEIAVYDVRRLSEDRVHGSCDNRMHWMYASVSFPRERLLSVQLQRRRLEPKQDFMHAIQPKRVRRGLSPNTIHDHNGEAAKLVHRHPSFETKTPKFDKAWMPHNVSWQVPAAPCSRLSESWQLNVGGQWLFAGCLLTLGSCLGVLHYRI